MKSNSVARRKNHSSEMSQKKSFYNVNSSSQYVAVLGRQPLISIAELESLYDNVSRVAPSLATFDLPRHYPKYLTKPNSFSLDANDEYFPDIPNLERLGGTLKLGIKIDQPIVTYLKQYFEHREGKITLGISDFSKRSNPYQAQKEALKLKRILSSQGKSVRVIPNKSAVLSSATSLHNRLFSENKIELLKNGANYYRVIACQNIEDYAKRDQARPARDAKVGMLPPKLAQILINLCNTPTSYLESNARILDPFCGTGVVCQEALLMGFRAYGSDLEPRMIDYSEKNLKWLLHGETERFTLEQGDATSHQWKAPISGVACEVFLGQPMSLPPVDIKLKQEKQRCQEIILGFLKNLAGQITADTPITLAIPAWLRPDGSYSRLNILDEIAKLGYNVRSFKNLGQHDLLYHRENQVVAREIISLRKK